MGYLNDCVDRLGFDSCGSQYGQVVGCFEHGDESSVSSVICMAVTKILVQSSFKAQSHAALSIFLQSSNISQSPTLVPNGLLR
jgi:hypothetical protein